MELLRRANNFITRHMPVKTARARAPRPIASISFDDFPKSAWTVAGPILARFGVAATYYTAGSFCGRTVEGMEFYDEGDLRALGAAGHEIACHGFAHQRTTQLSPEDLVADAARNRAFLEPFRGGVAPVSYAFPYGAASPRSKRFFAPRFSNARGVHPGVNHGAVDLAQLHAASMESRCWNPDWIEKAISRAKSHDGWLAFYTHDVSDTPSPYGSTPAMLIHVLKRLREENIEIRTMADAFSAQQF
ncbi:MAG TPA: polysaccharide deacetylase family protein [Rhizomicrobium sp.]